MKYKCLVNNLVAFIVFFVLLVEDVRGRPALLGHGLPLLRAIQDIVNKQTTTKHTRDTAVCTNESQDIMPILQLIKELVRSDIEYERKLQKKSNAIIQKIPKKYFHFKVGVKPKYKKLFKLRKYHNKKIALGKEEGTIAQVHNKDEYGLSETYTSDPDNNHNADSITTTDFNQDTRKTISEKEFTESTTGTSGEKVGKFYTGTESAQTSPEVVETATCPLYTTTIAEEIPTTPHHPKTEFYDATWSTDESLIPPIQTSTEISTSTDKQSSYSTTNASSITTYQQKDETITEFRLSKYTTEKSSEESKTTVEQIIINENTEVTDSILTGSITTETGLTHNKTDNQHSQIYSTSTLRTGGNSDRHLSSSRTPPNADHSTNVTGDGGDSEVDTEFRQNGSVLFEVPEDTRSFTHWCEGCSESEHTPNGTGVGHGDGGISNSGTEIADEFTGLEPAKLERYIGNKTEKFFESEKFFDTGYGNIVVEAITLPEPLQSHGNLRKGVFGIPQRDAGSERVTDRSSEPAQEYDETEPSKIYTKVNHSIKTPNVTSK